MAMVGRRGYAPGSLVGLGIAIGAGVGMALGLVLGNMVLGIACGVGIGLVLGAVFDQRRTSEAEGAEPGMRRGYLVAILLGG